MFLVPDFTNILDFFFFLKARHLKVVKKKKKWTKKNEIYNKRNKQMIGWDWTHVVHVYRYKASITLRAGLLSDVECFAPYRSSRQLVGFFFFFRY